MSLKAIISTSGLTRRKVAAMVGVKERTFDSYVRGERKLPIRIAKSLALVLQVRWTAFYEDEDSLGMAEKETAKNER